MAKWAALAVNAVGWTAVIRRVLFHTIPSQPAANMLTPSRSEHAAHASSLSERLARETRVFLVDNGDQCDRLISEALALDDRKTRAIGFDAEWRYGLLLSRHHPLSRSPFPDQRAKWQSFKSRSAQQRLSFKCM